MWDLKYYVNELIYKTEIKKIIKIQKTKQKYNHRYRKKIYGDHSVKVGKGEVYLRCGGLRDLHCCI